MKIMVLDDDLTILNLATDLLADLGFEVVSTTKPMQALQKLKCDNFDLLITDIMMPGISGLDILRELRLMNTRTKTIIMTGFGDIETAQIAAREGAYDYILKPFDNDEFRKSVKNALARKELEEENIKLKEFTGLLKFSELLTSQSSLQILPQMILESIVKQLRAAQGSIMLLNQKSNKLHIAAAIGLEEKIIKETDINIGERIAGRVIRDGSSVLVSNIDTDPDYKNYSCGHPDKTFMSVPIQLEDNFLSLPLTTSKNMIGVINVRRKENEPPFQKTDLDVLSILSVQAAIAIENHRLFSDLSNIYLGVIQFMVALTEARDIYLRGHTKLLTNLCLRLGHHFKLDKKSLMDLKYAAILHDIGKLAISENILNKPAKLNEEEMEIIRKHPLIGAEILKPFSFLKDTRHIVMHHHERYDGQGYPDKLSGDQINLPTHIIILADAYDAMNSTRAYRRALGKEEICEELKKNNGTQFHPQVVEAMFGLLKKIKVK